MMNKIAIPNIGNYYIPISYVFKKITNSKIIYHDSMNAPNYQHVLQSSNYPIAFIDTLNDYLVSLKQGANILIQLNNSFDTDLQVELLEHLGYNFQIINLTSNNHLSLIKTYRFAKMINNKLNILSFLYYVIQGILMLILIDKYENYQRKNTSKTKNSNLLNDFHTKLLKAYNCDTLSIWKIINIYYEYHRKLKLITLKEDSTPINLLIIGEPYIIINKFNNIEEKLLSQNISIHRYANLTHQLFKNHFVNANIMYESKRYIKHSDNNTKNNIYQIIAALHNNIDGIIHAKSKNNVSELNTINILNELSKDYGIKILYLTYGTDDIYNKIENFYDQLQKKKNT